MDNNLFVVSTLTLTTLQRLRKVDDLTMGIDIAGGLGQTLAGSGEMKVSPEVVAVGSKPRTVTFTYTARAAISAAEFTLTRPADGFPEGLVYGNVNKAMDNYVRFGTKPAKGTLTTDGAIITVEGLELAKDKSFTIVIEDLQATDDSAEAHAHEWAADLVDTDVAAGSPSIYVVQESNNAATVAVEFEVVDDDNGLISSPRYSASEQGHIRFRFTLNGTPIKGGAVWFDIPRNWAPPSMTDALNRATVRLVTNPESTPDAELNPEKLVDEIDADTTLKVSGYEIRVNITKMVAKGTVFTIQYGKDGDDNKYQGQVASEAGDVEIIGRFNSGLASRGHPAGRIAVTIDNVADGSGTAMISTNNSSDRQAVKAGSKGNTITVIYTAEGDMDGGKVSLEIPEGWGPMQELDDEEDNYIEVNASRSEVDQDEIDYGDRFVVVNLKEFGKNDSFQFVLSNAVAQKGLGLSEFRIESAGSATGSLMGLAGEPLPADDEDSSVKEDDPFLLLGQVFAPLGETEDDLGLLRIVGTGGEGGSGEASHEVVRSDGGLSDYLDEDGDIVQERRVHAGDDNIYLLFTYTPVETIEGGMLRLVVDSDWDKPQEDTPNKVGYTDVDGGDIGVPNYENYTVDIPIDYIQVGDDPHHD